MWTKKILSGYLWALLTVGQCFGLNSDDSSDSGTVRQRLECYEGKNLTGESFVVYHHVDDLTSEGFDNRISSCLINGVWILYENYFYNGEEQGGYDFFAYGTNYSVNMGSNFDNVASSARFAGLNSNYTSPTLNLYRGEYFIGELQSAPGHDVNEFDFDENGSSVIITGSSDWTIFEEANFQGISTCLKSTDDPKIPTFFPTRASIGMLGGKINSAKMGCDLSKVNYIV